MSAERSPSRRRTRVAEEPADAEPAGRWERIYAVVRRIPPGRVATYGQVADLAGLHGHARQVGYALHALGDQGGVPWHRVINAQGRLSLEKTGPGGGLVQRFRLEEEGVEFGPGDRVSLRRYRWEPDAAPAEEDAPKRARRSRR